MEFSFAEVITILLRRVKFLVICTFLVVCAFFVFNKYIKSPIYTASVQLYVNSNTPDASADINSLNYAQKVVTTYINFLQTNTFYEKVIEESGLAYYPGQLRSMTQIKTINNTEIFQISVTSNSPDDSYQLAATMQQVAPDSIKSILNTSKISVVDPVVYPVAPSGPNVISNTIMGGILGLFLSILAVLIWEMINNNVKNPDDLKKKYDLPLLSTIPHFHHPNKKLLRIPFLKRQGNTRIIGSDIQDETRLIVLEEYNSLRTNLRFLLRQDGCKKIMITSPSPDEGKSTVSANLAISIAQTGSNVLLLDCDLRKGTLHNFFHLKSVPGISDTLSGMITEKEALQGTKYSNLKVMAMGSVPPNPNELLGSEQMVNLLKHLEALYDYIIIDTPPINIVSDAFNLVNLVDGVILVVREGTTSHLSISNALIKFRFSEANLLGLVLNGLSYSQGNKKLNYNYYSHHR